MSYLPTGVVTFLYTDVEDSTLLWEREPEAMRKSIELHNAILTEAITSHQGVKYKYLGDAFLFAFVHPAQAIQSAIKIQRDISATEWEISSSLRVRIGIHTGPVEIRGDEYISHTLNRVVRVTSAAHGGQILLTKAVTDLVDGELPDDSKLRDMGEHYLKGMTHPEHLYQVVLYDLPSDFPPLNVSRLAPNNLPVGLTSFIGRDNEIEKVQRLLRDSRLVTLTGSGGVGKTRLSIEVGRRVLAVYTDGVWLIELASLTDQQLVPQAVADVLGIHEYQDRPLIDRLIDHLCSRSCLLILDNCEHLIEGCAQLVDTFLNACSRLVVLTTSREPLELTGERTFHVPNLSLPVDEDGPLETIIQSEALQLFVDRARTAMPGFQLTVDNSAPAAQICRRLDGIPLAIELAAARVMTLRVEQIAKRLDDLFRLLTGGSRTALPRQQTLRATIDWSYQLLTTGERLLLQRLSVFSGGCTLKAVEVICSDKDIKERDILDVLTSLVNKSMVVADRQQGKPPRFRMLEIVRQYAREKLFESGNIATYRDRHLRYFLEWAEQADVETRGPEQATWLEQLGFEYENLSTALEWAAENNQGSGLRLASALWWFMWMRNKGQECVRWLSYFIDCQSDQNIQGGTFDARRGIALGRLAFFFMMHPIHLSRAEELAFESLSISQAIGDQSSKAFAYFILGYIFYYRKTDYINARSCFEQSMALYETSNDPWGMGRNYYNIGHMEGRQGNTLSQRDYLERSLAICRQAGDLRGIAIALDNLAAVRVEIECDLRGGREMVEEAIDIYQQLKAPGAMGHALNVYGRFLSWQGDFEHAHKVYLELEEVLRQRGGAIWNVESKCNFGFIYRLEGKDTQALNLFEECLRRVNELDPDHVQYQIDLTRLLIEVGLVLAHTGETIRARDLLNQALSLATAPLHRAMALQGLGLAALADQDGKSAGMCLLQSLELFQKSSYRFYAISALEDYAAVLQMIGKDARATRLLGTTAAVRQAIGAPVPPRDLPRMDRLRMSLQANLDEASFNQVWSESQAMTLDGAISHVMRDLLWETTGG